MSMTDVLIITGGHLCRNPRAFKEAAALAEAGLAVKVLSVRNHAPSHEHDAALCEDARFQHVELDLLRTTVAGKWIRFRSKLSTWVARKLQEAARRESVHALGPARHLLHQARAIPARLTIVHTELPLWIGTQLLQEGRCVAADIEDWHSEDLQPEARASRPLRLLAQTEALLLREAVYTTTTSTALANALYARYGGTRPSVLTNSFPLDACPRREPNTVVKLFWFSQTIGPGRGLEPLLTAWSNTRSPSKMVLLGDIDETYKAALLGRLPAPFRSRVTFLRTVPNRELPRLIAQHDIGCALEESSPPSRNLTITNKILQYLNAGLAVVASNTTGQQEVLAQSPDAGILVDLQDPHALTHALESLTSDLVLLQTCQAAARRLAEKSYCWENEKPKLIALVEKALGKRNTADLPVP